jgi:hypothetical protein
VHDKASLLALPLEDTVPPAVLEAGVGRKTAAQEAAARHVRDALGALGYGHGVHWAADITTLPLRFVARVARAHGLAGDEHDGWGCPAVPPDSRQPGRCGACGHLETAPGHEVTCGRAPTPGGAAADTRGIPHASR